MDILLNVRVHAKTWEAVDIAAFELTPVGDTVLPAFEAGAHLDVHAPGGTVRQYSLYELPSVPPRFRIAVLRDPKSRGGSVRLLDTVSAGDMLEVGPPRNHFGLHPGLGRTLLFAGGIGITPILCMAERLARDGRDFELHYSGRTLSRMAFVDHVLEHYRDRVSIHADDGGAEQHLEVRGVIGRPAPDKHLYICGPTGYMDYVLEAGRGLGWDEAHLHREYFAGLPIDHSADGPFELELRRTGTVVRVAADQTAAQALVEAGVAVSLSCEQGVCGTCQTTVLSGRPDHRDFYLTEAERKRNDTFMPCCSRSCTSRLAIDL